MTKRRNFRKEEPAAHNEWRKRREHCDTRLHYAPLGAEVITFLEAVVDERVYDDHGRRVTVMRLREWVNEFDEHPLPGLSHYAPPAAVDLETGKPVRGYWQRNGWQPGGEHVEWDGYANSLDKVTVWTQTPTDEWVADHVACRPVREALRSCRDRAETWKLRNVKLAWTDETEYDENGRPRYKNGRSGYWYEVNIVEEPWADAVDMQQELAERIEERLHKGGARNRWHDIEALLDEAQWRCPNHVEAIAQALYDHYPAFAEWQACKLAHQQHAGRKRRVTEQSWPKAQAA